MEDPFSQFPNCAEGPGITSKFINSKSSSQKKLGKPRFTSGFFFFLPFIVFLFTAYNENILFIF